MLKIASLTGKYLVQLTDQYFPSNYGERGAATEAMAESLGISKRSLMAFMSEERRVPEEVEKKIIDRIIAH